MDTDPSLLRLLQLASPALPIGMYSYSQGLEYAVERSWVNDAETAGVWIEAVMHRCQARLDLPVLSRLYDAWLSNEKPVADYWNSYLLACRETAEMRAEDIQTGQALARLLAALEPDGAVGLQVKSPISLAYAFSLAAVHYDIVKSVAMTGYLWSWLENQIVCAVKLVPLGQVAGQRLLRDLATEIPALVNEALQLADNDIGGSVFSLSLASSRHESQYSRLFRS